MGLLETISGDVGAAFQDALGRGETGRLPGIISEVLSRTGLGSLNGLIARLQQGGLGEQVSSWLGNRQNLPVSVEQLRAALGSEYVQQLARRLGLPVDEALSQLSENLPAAIDRASPNGSLPAGA